MTRSILAAAMLLALAGCGADGAPMAPAAKPGPPGVTISGEARMGVSTTL